MAGNKPEINWAVDIPALNTAISQVSAERDEIKANVAAMKARFNDIEASWQGPAGRSLIPLVDTFNTDTGHLVNLLDDAIDRMRSAYNNYVNTETANVANLR